MPLKFPDILGWAEALAIHATPGEDSYELFARDAIRHSYYSCYHAALAWAKKRGYKKPPKVSSHKALWNWYSADLNTKDIGSRARGLHKKRIRADYELGKPIQDDPQKAVKEAKELIDLLTKDGERVANDPNEPMLRGTVPPQPAIAVVGAATT